jgi:hypothetical protein
MLLRMQDFLIRQAVVSEWLRKLIFNFLYTEYRSLHDVAA